LFERLGFDTASSLATAAAHPQPGQPLHPAVPVLRVAGS
jgi:hypothetical protein